MTFLTTNYSALSENDYSPMPEGNYEMVIQRLEKKTTKNGKEALTFWLVVRNDLTKVTELAETNGKYPNRYVFDDHWKRNVNGNYQLDANNLMYVLKAAGIPEGTNFTSFEDLQQIMTGKPVRVYVKKEYDDYNQQDTNTVAPWNYSVTQFPQVNHQWKSEEKTDPFPTNDAPTITDADVPF